MINHLGILNNRIVPIPFEAPAIAILVASSEESRTLLPEATGFVIKRLLNSVQHPEPTGMGGSGLI